MKKTKLTVIVDNIPQGDIKGEWGLSILVEYEDKKILEQIGNALGFSKERIRQIENLAIQKLRRVENVESLRSYLDAG